MIGAFVLGCALHLAPDTHSGMQAAIDAVRAGDFLEAERAANGEQDVLTRHQAVVYVRHQAGDLDGALAEAESGSRAFPDDAWLQDRRVYIALTLRRSEVAEAAVGALERLADRATTTERDRWAATARGYRAELGELQRQLVARDCAERRSIWVTVGCLIASTTLLLGFARRGSV